MIKTKPNQKKGFTIFLFIVIAILTVGLRLYKLDTPLADFHSWRQADTASVARNFVDDGIDLLKPRYDDLSNIQSGIVNPHGYRMVEFPVYNAGIALLNTTNVCNIEVCGRLLSILAAVTTTMILFYLLLKEHGLLSAVMGSLTFAVSPFFVYFTRVVLPDPTAVAFAMSSIFFLYLFTENQKNRRLSLLWYFISLICFALAVLVKPTTIFYAVPLGYLFIRTYTWDVLKKPLIYIFWILAFVPLLLWRQYILQFPEGIPASEWLFTSVNTAGGLQNIFFKPSFFRWIFFERINNLLLGGFLTPFFILGALSRQKRYLSHSILLGSLAFLFIFQGGNVQHEYYQTMIFPALAMFVGIGISYLHTHSRQFISSTILIPVIMALYIFSVFISYYTVRNYYNYSDELVQISKIVRTLTSRNDLIVTDTLGDTTLLYLSERRGAPAVYKDLTELKHDGYKYFVTQKIDVADEIISHKTHTPIFRSDKFVVFEL
jgi:hypothetical protein